MAILKLVQPVDLYPTPTILKIRLNSEISNQELIHRNQTAIESGFGFRPSIPSVFINNYLKYTSSRIVQWKGRENEISRVCARGDGWPWKIGQCMADAGGKKRLISFRIISVQKVALGMNKKCIWYMTSYTHTTKYFFRCSVYLRL